MSNSVNVLPLPPEIIVHITFIREKDRALYVEDQSPDNIFPEQGTPISTGCDLRACLNDDAVIEPGQRMKIGTGIAIQIQSGGIGAFVYSRSGLGAVKGLTVAQGVGVIDPDYTGEIVVYMLNTSQQAITIHRGDRIAQIVFQPFFKPKWQEKRKLEQTTRGAGGFGHTGLI